MISEQNFRVAFDSDTAGAIMHVFYTPNNSTKKIDITPRDNSLTLKNVYSYIQDQIELINSYLTDYASLRDYDIEN
jgi:hypothetical protein